MSPLDLLYLWQALNKRSMLSSRSSLLKKNSLEEKEASVKTQKKQISSGKRTTKIFNFLPGHQEVMKNHYKASLNTCNSFHHCIKMHQHKTKYVHKGIVHDVSHCGTVHVKPNTHHSLEHNAFNHRSHCIIGT